MHDLETGDRRIFRHGQAGEDDGWVLAVFSVPETDRHLRHRLRTELSWLGFGTVSPGVWVAPAPLAGPSRDLLAAAGLDRYVTWFHARHLGEVDVAAWWDLSGLEASVRGVPVPLALAGRRRRPADRRGGVCALPPADRRVAALFPGWIPACPHRCFPQDWPARQAWEVFRDLREQWSAPGWRFVRSVTGSRANQPG